MKLLVGLGNPGKEYEKTRHNAGFMCVDEVAKKCSLNFDTKKFKALMAVGNIQGEKVILMKPQTYMNLSGEAVGECVRYFNIPLEDICVIMDDLDLPIGKIRLREKGSSGGQNGVKNIIAHLGSQEFKRIRIGIGHDRKYDTKDYVLGKIGKEDAKDYEDAISRASNAAYDFITSRPFNRIMGDYN